MVNNVDATASARWRWLGLIDLAAAAISNTPRAQEFHVSRRTLGLTDRVYDYLLGVSLREPAAFRRLRAENAKLPSGGMQISPEVGQFMALLVEMLGARRTLEIGTFTGYSALWVASALPRGGRVVACDVSREYTDIAKRYWRRARLADKIDLRLGPALATLDGLIDDGEAGGFDFAFIDADKENYDGYYERCLALLRPGGVVAFDNVLWGGSVADPSRNTPETRALRRIARKVHKDPRVSISFLPIGDGLLLARKRGRTARRGAAKPAQRRRTRLIRPRRR
jgi:caffeoyl-CoA O-methyltransferase